MNHDCSYSDFFTQISSIFCIKSLFTIKCQLHGESLKYLIVITSDEDLTNIVEEKEELEGSMRPAAHLHLFVLPKVPSSPPETTSEVMLGASIKINVVKNDGKTSKK